MPFREELKMDCIGTIVHFLQQCLDSVVHALPNFLDWVISRLRG